MDIEVRLSLIHISVHKERIEQNLDIWDFQLSQKDMEEISGLDVGPVSYTHLKASSPPRCTTDGFSVLVPRGSTTAVQKPSAAFVWQGA